MSGTRQLSTLGLPLKIVAALTRAGFATVGDLAGISAQELAEELALDQPLPPVLLAHLPGSSHLSDPPSSFSIPASQLLSRSLTTLANTHNPIASSSASALRAKPQTYSTRSTKVNALLSPGTPNLQTSSQPSSSPSAEGGLRSLHVLEICGPPGSGKACLTLELLRSAVARGETVLVADTQSALTPGRIYDALDSLRTSSSNATADRINDPSQLVLRIALPTLSHLIAFSKMLPTYLTDNPKIRVLVLSLLSFLFQPTEYATPSTSDRTRILGSIKQTLTRACMEHGVTVIVTNQSSTKIINSEGSNANFETGSKGILTSPIGSSICTASRSYRLMLGRDALGGRRAHLISSPAIASALQQKSKSSSSASKNSRSDSDVLKSENRVAGFLIDVEGRVRDV